MDFFNFVFFCREMRNGPPVKREANQEENENQNFAQFFSPSEDEGIRLHSFP